MTHDRKVLDAIAAVIVAADLVGPDAAFECRGDSIHDELLPAIDVWPVDDVIEPLGTGVDAHNMQIRIDVLVRESKRDQSIAADADPICDGLHRALAANPTLNGLVRSMRLTNRQWSVERADGTLLQVSMFYRARWAGSQADLAVQAI